MGRKGILALIVVSTTVMLLASGCEKVDTLGDTFARIINELGGIGDALSDLIEGITRSIGRIRIQVPSFEAIAIR